MALMKILALATRQIEDGRVLSSADAIKGVRERRMSR